MDKLEKIFKYQKKFDDEIIKERKLDHSMEEWIQMETLALMSELAELLDEVQFKWWKNKKTTDLNAVKNELVDVLHFFVSMCIKTGMDANELFERYMEKNKENFERQYGLSEKKGYELDKQ